jgi:hypothetical protein
VDVALTSSSVSTRSSTVLISPDFEDERSSTSFNGTTSEVYSLANGSGKLTEIHQLFPWVSKQDGTSQQTPEICGFIPPTVIETNDLSHKSVSVVSVDTNLDLFEVGRSSESAPSTGPSPMIIDTPSVVSQSTSIESGDFRHSHSQQVVVWVEIINNKAASKQMELLREREIVDPLMPDHTPSCKQHDKYRISYTRNAFRIRNQKISIVIAYFNSTMLVMGITCEMH